MQIHQTNKAGQIIQSISPTHKTPNKPLDQPNITKYQRNETPITVTLISNSLINNIDPYKVKDLDIKKKRAGKLHDCSQMQSKVTPEAKIVVILSITNDIVQDSVDTCVQSTTSLVNNFQQQFPNKKLVCPYPHPEVTHQG